VSIVIDKHFEYSILLEDIAAQQELDSHMEFRSDDAGFQLSKKIDTELLTLGKSLGDGDGTSFVNSASFYVDASTGLTAYAVDTVTSADLLTDAGFMGIDRYSSSDFVNNRVVENGLIANLYGIDILMSTNLITTETASENSAGGALKAAMLFHEDSLVLSMQQDIRTQTQYKQEWLAELMTSDCIFGVKAYRPDTAFNLVVNA
jgi:glutamate-1-semialdehyde aminotransferase